MYGAGVDAVRVWVGGGWDTDSRWQIPWGQPKALNLREGSQLPSQSQHRFLRHLLSQTCPETNVMIGVSCAPVRRPQYQH